METSTYYITHISIESIVLYERDDRVMMTFTMDGERGVKYLFCKAGHLAKLLTDDSDEADLILSCIAYVLSRNLLKEKGSYGLKMNKIIGQPLRISHFNLEIEKRVKRVVTSSEHHVLKKIGLK